MCRNFLDEEYPFMVDAESILKVIEDIGYLLLDYYTLDESLLWDEYYEPLERCLAVLEAGSAHDPNRLEVIERVRSVIEMYPTYSDYYGHVFFVMKHVPGFLRGRSEEVVLDD